MKMPDTPSDKTFEEIKTNAIIIWQTYDDTHGYASEKVSRIKDIQNLRDNYAFILGMFDDDNQEKLVSLLSREAREELKSLKRNHRRWTIS